jgi:GNAT superfamily N-acetyltransferase
MGPATGITRPATPDDIPTIRGILAAHGNDGPVTRVDIVGPYVRHLVTHHRTLLTEEAGAAVAFGAVVDAGLAVHLADLFVMPDRLGRGLGRQLLAALFGDEPRRTTFASDDPRALPLYVRAGMTPLWPTLHVEGDASRLTIAPGLAVVAAAPEELAALELAWTGADRREDHRFWASQADADPFLVVDREGPVALAIGRARQVSDVRVIDRMRVRPGADPVPSVLAALRRTDRGTRVVASLLGPSPVLPVLLEAGFHVTDRDQFMASDAGLIDPVRFLPNPGML